VRGLSRAIGWDNPLIFYITDEEWIKLENSELSPEAKKARSIYQSARRPKRNPKPMEKAQKNFYEKLAKKYIAEGIMQKEESRK
jgi:hypothetical protein